MKRVAYITFVVMATLTLLILLWQLRLGLLRRAQARARHLQHQGWTSVVGKVVLNAW